MAKTNPSVQISIQHARAILVAAQGLSSSPVSRLLETVEETGFVRTLGGVDVYLAVRARVPKLRRADLDQAVEAGDLQVKPAARGCIYLVPRRHVSLCLRFADLRTRARNQREQEKAGIRPGEVEEIADAVVEVLQSQGPLTTDAIRRALPDGMVRSLGADGKKVGISSPLPPALRLLEFSGRVERAQENQRLDTERYQWRIPRQNPFEAHPVPEDPDALNVQLAAIFWRAAGLATLKSFAGWAGIAQRDAKAALEQLELVPVSIEGEKETYFALPAREPWLSKAPNSGAVALIPFEDNLIACQGGLQLLVDRAHHGVEVTAWGGGRKKIKIGDAKHADLRSVVAEGAISGFWEYHPDEKSIVHHCFSPLSKTVRDRLEEAAADTARFLAEDVGHGQSFSLDTDQALRKRVELVRGL